MANCCCGYNIGNNIDSSLSEEETTGLNWFLEEKMNGEEKKIIEEIKNIVDDEIKAIEKEKKEED